MPPEQHGMVPGSHERGNGPECRCGAGWDRWNDRCVAESASTPTTSEES